MTAKTKTLEQRLAAQAERTLLAIERAPEPAEPKDLGTLGRLVERLRGEQQRSELEREVERMNAIAGD